MDRWKTLPDEDRGMRRLRTVACTLGTLLMAIFGVVIGWLLMSWASPLDAIAECDSDILLEAKDVPYMEVKAETAKPKKEKTKAVAPEPEEVSETDIPDETAGQSVMETETYEAVDEVQEEAPMTYETDIPEQAEGGAYYTSDELMFEGELYDEEGQRYTWYSQNVLPGGGLDIPGRHVDEEGYVVDGDGYVVLAYDEASRGEVMDIPFGTGVGKVYDVCETEGTVDVYTDF